MEKKESFLLYKSNFDNLKLLTMEERGQLLTGIINHVNGEELPEMSTAATMLLSFITAQIDRNNIKYKNCCENGKLGAEYGILGKEYGKLGAEYGKLGGRPKKKVDAEEENEQDGGGKTKKDVDDAINRLWACCNSEQINLSDEQINGFYNALAECKTYQEKYVYINAITKLDVKRYFEDKLYLS